ncbi:MAG: hypothetical protein RL095_1865 [Verrucomicrobiota bacterium]|jgi:hypothetical protein
MKPDPALGPWAVIDFETVGGRHGPVAVEFGLLVINAAGQILFHLERQFPPPEDAGRSSPVPAGLRQLWPEIAPWLEAAVLTGHNLGYDEALLRAAFPGFTPPSRLDTLMLSRHCLPRAPEHSLEALAKAAGIDAELQQMAVNSHFRPHRALYDCFACALLLLHLRQKPESASFMRPAQGSLWE